MVRGVGDAGVENIARANQDQCNCAHLGTLVQAHAIDGLGVGRLDGRLYSNKEVTVNTGCCCGGVFGGAAQQRFGVESLVRKVRVLRGEERGGCKADGTAFVTTCSVRVEGLLVFQRTNELTWVFLNPVDHQVDACLGNLLSVLGVCPVHVQGIFTGSGIDGTYPNQRQHQDDGYDYDQGGTSFRRTVVLLLRSLGEKQVLFHDCVPSLSDQEVDELDLLGKGSNTRRTVDFGVQIEC